MFASFIRTALIAATDRKGVTAAEYAVMAVAIIGAVGLGVAAFAPKLQTALSGLIV